MSSIIAKRHHLEYYNCNTGIIVQFLLFELIQAFEKTHEVCAQIAQIKMHLHKKKSQPLISLKRSASKSSQTKPNALEDEAEKNALNSIIEAMSCLAGHSQKTMRIFIWNLNEGILAKIKLHSSMLKSSLDTATPNLCSLQRIADHSWSLSLECLDLMRETKQITELDLLTLCNILDKMQQKLKRLIKILASILPQFHDDENVIYFLLNHKQSINAMYEDNFVEKLFGKMFPAGLADLKQFLSKRYTKRGFKHLLPQITQKLLELEKGS